MESSVDDISRIDSGFDDLDNETKTSVSEDEVFREKELESSESEAEMNSNAAAAKKEDNTVSEVAQNAVKQRFMSTFNLIKKCGMAFAGISSIWLLGYFEFSIVWLLIGVTVYGWREQRRVKHGISSKVALEIAKDERKFLQTVKDVYKMSGKDLPSWVYFPDMEKAEWMNKIVLQLWPYIGDYVKNMLEEQIQPSIQQSNTLLSGFKFAEVDLGDAAPRVVGVKVYDSGQTRRTEIVMDLHFVFHSDCNIKVSVNRLSAGIKSLTIKGQLRVELRPLIEEIPLVGAVSVAFIQEPFIDFNLTDLGNLLDFPGLDSILRGSVMDCVCGLLVLPERYILKLSDVDVSTLKYPLPKGVIRIHIIEARNLEEKDKKILGIGGGSDPYVEVKVGRDQVFKTAIIDHNVNPEWNESFDAVVHDIHGSSIEVTLYDDDGALNKADYLGFATVPIKSVYKQGVIDEWIALDNVTQGSIHVKIEWMELSSNKTQVKVAIDEARKYNLCPAFVNIYVDSAKNIVDVNENRYEPSPQLRIQFPNQSKPWKSAIIEDTTNPVWEENCKALISNPTMDSIKFTVKNVCRRMSKVPRKVSTTVLKHYRSLGAKFGKVDNSSKTGNEDILGLLQLKTKKILEAPGMVKEEPFALNNAGPNATLVMRVTMRLLVPVGKKDSKSGLLFTVTTPKKPKEKVPEFTYKETKEPIIEEKDEDDSSNVDPVTPVTHDNNNLNHKRTESETSSSPSIKFDAGGTLNTPGLHRSPSSTSGFSNTSGSENLRKRLDQKLAAENGSANKDSPLGRLKLSLKHLKASETLVVTVHKAEDLIICDDDNNTSDPYVRIYMMPNKKRRKTKVIKNNLNPVFEENLKFELHDSDIKEHQLEISVKNDTSILSSEKVLMGQVNIDLANVDWSKCENIWYTLNVHEKSD